MQCGALCSIYKKIKDVGKLCQQIVEEWEHLRQHVTDNDVIRQWCRRLQVCWCRWWTVRTFSVTDILTTTVDVIVVSQVFDYVV